MIRINFECDTVAQLHSEMVSLLAGTVAVSTPAPSTGEEAPAKRGRGKKAEEKIEPPTAPQEPASGNAEGNAEGNSTQTSTGDAISSGTQSSAAGEVTKESLSSKFLTLVTKAGAPAGAELLGEFGATKMSEVPVEKYVQMDARLTELIG